MISALQKQGWRARNRCQWIAFRYESFAKGFLLGFLSGMPLLPYGAYLGIAQQHRCVIKLVRSNYFQGERTMDGVACFSL